MKKITYVILLLSTIALNGCTKSDNNSSGGGSYTLSALSNYTATEYADTAFTVPITVTAATGTTGALTLTPTGMPAGVTVLPTSFVGEGSFNTAFVFQANASVSGTYPITITAASASGSKTYSFNLVINPGVLFAYSLTGLPASITFSQYTDTTITLPLSIAFGSGTVETVNLSTATPPAGVTLTVTPTSGTPPFSSTLTLNAAINTAGTYPVTINSSATGTGTQTHTVNLIVTPNSDCSGEITKTFTADFSANTTCASYSGMGTGVSGSVIKTNGTSNELLLNSSFGITFRAELNCAAGTFTAPDTTNVDFTATGISGTFSPSTIIVNYTLSGAISSACTTTYTR